MKTNYLLFKNNIFLFFSMVFLSTSVLISCSDKEDIEDPSFKIVGNPSVLSVDLDESTTTYEVLSNRPWKVVAVETGDWAKASPSEGIDNGTFKIIVQENKTFEKRVMNFAFVVDGEEQPGKFRVEQGSLEASLKVPSAEAGLSVNADGGNVSIGVEGNVEWKYTMENGSWLTEDTKTATELVLVAAANEGSEERKTTVTFTSESLPNFSTIVVITQAAAPAITEYVKGGNFEAGSEAFWTITDFTDAEDPYIKIKDGKLRFGKAFNPDGVVYQAIKLEAGVAYKLNGWMKNFGFEGDQYPQIRITLDTTQPIKAESDGDIVNIYFNSTSLVSPFENSLLQSVNGHSGINLENGEFTVPETKTYYLVFKDGTGWGFSGLVEFDSISITKK